MAQWRVPFREIEMGPVGGRLPAGAVTAACPIDAGILVQFTEGSATFLPDWLRDNCLCHECRIVQTDERRWQPWTEPTAPVVDTRRRGRRPAADRLGRRASVHVRPGRVGQDPHHRRPRRVDGRLWSSGVRDRAVRPSAVRRRPGHATRTCSRRFDATARSVVTGSPTEPGTVIEFLRAIGLTLRDSSLGLIFDVKLDPAGYNIAFTAEEVPPHNDNAQYTHPPSGQVLAMLVNDAKGGNSVVVDGWSVLDQLNREHPEAIDVLTAVEVGFRQYSTEADAFTRAPLVVRDRASGGSCTCGSPTS